MRADPAELRRRWQELSQRFPGRSRSDIARELEVSEGELLASRVGFGAIRLAPRWHALFTSLKALGQVQAVTQNSHAALVKRGHYSEVRTLSREWMSIDGDVGLQVAPKRLAFSFAFEPDAADDSEVAQTVEFYGDNGAAVHKIFLTEESSIDQFYEVVGSFLDKEQSDALEVRFEAKSTAPVAIDRDQLLDGWLRVTNAGELFQLLEKYALSHGQAVALVGSHFARQVANVDLRLVCDAIVESEIRVAVHVGNPACVQTCSGRFAEVGVRGGRLMLRNSDVALYVTEARVSTAWIVEMPGMKGRAASLNLFDAQGSEIVEITGHANGPVLGEDRWRTILEGLPD